MHKKLKKTFSILLLFFVVGAVVQTGLAQTAPFDIANLRTASSTLTAAYDKIKIQQAWEAIATSSFTITPVSIGIVDSGVDDSHQEFNNPDVDFGLLFPSLLFDISSNGHGTQVTGIIGANNVLRSGMLATSSPQMNGILSGALEESQYVLQIEQLGFLGFTTLSKEGSS